MKQSTKLLSLVLALIMAFSCMTVIGNAALVSSEVTYDSIDDAILSPLQVAGLALDLVDNDLLAGLETISIPVIGDIRLNSISNLLEDIIAIRGGTVWSIGSGLLKNVGALDFAPLNKGGDDWGVLGLGGTKDAYGRDDGDLTLLWQVLEFIGNDNNSEILSRVAYGIGDGGTLNSNGDLTNTSQLNLGLLDSFLDLGEIGDLLNDIPGALTEMAYDLLVHGSYLEGSTYGDESYPSVEDLNGADLPAPMNTLDSMIDNVILNLLSKPQDYTWEGEGEAAVKKWDMGSIISTSFAEDVDKGEITATDVSPRIKSFFQLLDLAAQYAIDDIAINALNNNLKKALMEAVEIDLNEIKAGDLPAEVSADFEVDVNDGEESYVTYLAYDRMMGHKGSYYYTTLKNDILDEDGDGVQDIDPETNEPLTKKVRKFYKANMASGNEFAALINWDWEFVGSDVTPTDAQVQLSYENIKKDYEDSDNVTSIVEGINDLLGLVYDVALNDTVKAEFTEFVGNGTGFVKGSNANLMTNIDNIAKFILVNYGKLVFGSTSPYAKLTRDEVIDLDTVDLIAMIGPGFFEDVMPQIIFPKNADGTYAFHDGVQIYEFGALVIREFISDITPNVNYDFAIFADETDGVASANDRQFKNYGTGDEAVNAWFNIILNMGLDIAYTYLYNISNFGDWAVFNAEGTGFASTAAGEWADARWRNDNQSEFPEFPALDETSAITSTRWQGMLDEVILWCVRYVGSTGSSIIEGFDYATVNAISGPLEKLSYILNKLLPLGFINGYSVSGKKINNVAIDFDIDSFLNNGLKGFFTDFDLARVLGLLGRNQDSSYNLLDDANLIGGVLDLVNRILNLIFREDVDGDSYTGLLQAVTTGSEQMLANVVSPANLKITVASLLRALNGYKKPIVLSALPVVGKLIKGWGTEQNFETPKITLDRSIILNNGATTDAQEVQIRNSANGVWRHYKDQAGNGATDAQFQIVPVSATVQSFTHTGDAANYVTITEYSTGNIVYGDYGTFKYTVSGVPAEGGVALFTYEYKVLDEDGAQLGGKTYKIQSYAWLDYAGTDEATKESYALNSNDGLTFSAMYPLYVDSSAMSLEALQSKPAIRIHRADIDRRTYINSITGGSDDGITAASGSVDDYLGASTERWWNGLTIFKDGNEYTNDASSDSNKNRTITLSGAAFDEATWGTAKDHANGTTSTVPVRLQGESKTKSWFADLTYSKTNVTYDATANVVLTYYNGADLMSLTNLAANEMSAARNVADYDLTNPGYADGILRATNIEDDTTTTEDEFELRQTNYSTLVWIDDDEIEYTTVTDVVETKDDDGNVIAATAKATNADGETVNVKRVTKIDSAAAWSTYKTAFFAAVRAGMQEFREGYYDWDFKGRYEALKVAAADIEYCKAENASGDSIDTPIDNLEALLTEVEAATTDNRNYTDYQMYRLNRLNDAREDARYFIDLKRDNEIPNVESIDESFPYTWIEEYELRNVVDLKENDAYVNSALRIEKDGVNIVTALLEKLDEEEINAKEEWLENRKNEYKNTSLLDVQLASGYLERVSGRLLYRFPLKDENNALVQNEDGSYAQDVILDYLDGEILSVDNVIGTPVVFDDDGYVTYDENGDAVVNPELAEIYTARSLKKFANAYAHAVNISYDEAEIPQTQKNVFDAKWELMTCRNELVLKVDEDGNNNEADYSELEELIAQAEMALSHTDLYINEAKDFGMVLAELGVDGKIINTNGDGIELFPGNAKYINTEPYSVDEQDTIDQAAEELKIALSRLKFKQTTVSRVDKDTNGNVFEIKDYTMKEADETNGVEAEILSNVTKIVTDKLDAAAVKALFTANVAEGGLDVSMSIVSNDINYSAMEDLEGFVGTDATITFYAEIDSVKIPVATVKLVVEGDVNGDGVLDVLDLGITQLVSVDHAELEGAYLLAGDLYGNDIAVDEDDYSAVVNKAIA